MSENKKVTVIIPTYKRADMMDKALESVLNQSYQDFEIVIVDDNGKGTPEQKDTEQYIKKFEGDTRIKYLINEKNMGACASRNRGIHASDTPFKAFLDDDDRWEKDFLKAVIERFDEDSTNRIGVVFAGFNIMDAQKNVLKKSNSKKKECDGMFNRLINGECPASTSLCVVKKVCFDVAGGFDEKLTSFQDYDMWLRIAKCGYEFAYIDKPLIVKYEGHGEQISINPEKRYNGLCRIKEKWTKILSAEENTEFASTLNKFENIIKKNRIIYNKEKGIRCSMSMYTDYLKTNDDLKSKLKITALMVFGKRMLQFRK